MSKSCFLTKLKSWSIECGAARCFILSLKTPESHKSPNTPNTEVMNQERSGLFGPSVTRSLCSSFNDRRLWRLFVTFYRSLVTNSTLMSVRVAPWRLDVIVCNLPDELEEQTGQHRAAPAKNLHIPLVCISWYIASFLYIIYIIFIWALMVSKLKHQHVLSTYFRRGYITINTPRKKTG